MNRNRAMMLKEIQELDFRMLELNLYLDTHPFDEKAVAEYNLASNKSIAMKKHFEKLYGPLTIEDKDDLKTPWQWIEGPWPWQVTENEAEGKTYVGL